MKFQKIKTSQVEKSKLWPGNRVAMLKNIRAIREQK